MPSGSSGAIFLRPVGSKGCVYVCECMYVCLCVYVCMCGCVCVVRPVYLPGGARAPHPSGHCAGMGPWGHFCPGLLPLAEAASTRKGGTGHVQEGHASPWKSGQMGGMQRQKPSDKGQSQPGTWAEGPSRSAALDWFLLTSTIQQPVWLSSGAPWPVCPLFDS